MKLSETKRKALELMAEGAILHWPMMSRGKVTVEGLIVQFLTPEECQALLWPAAFVQWKDPNVSRVDYIITHAGREALKEQASQRYQEHIGNMEAD